jgi:hypothetical protein
MKQLSSTPLIYLISSLPHISLDNRKILLDYVRIQTPYDKLSSFYLPEFKSRLRRPCPLFYDEEYQGTCMLYQIIPSNLDSPIFSSLYSMLIRSAPSTNQQEVDDALQASLAKELQAARGDYRPTEFVWTALFEYPRKESSIAPHLSLRTKLQTHHRIFWSLTKAKENLQDLVIYPDTSQKTMGRQTREDAEPFFCYKVTEVDGVLHYSLAAFS